MKTIRYFETMLRLGPDLHDIGASRAAVTNAARSPN